MDLGFRAPGFWRTLVVSVATIVAACSGSGDGGGGSTGPTAAVAQRLAAATEEVSVRVPSGATPEATIIGASGSVRLDDRVTLGDGSKLEQVGSFGGSGTHVAAGVLARGSFVSQGPVWIGSQARIDGSVRSAGSITAQAGAVVTGGRFPNVPVASTATTWTAELPATPDTAISVEPDRTVELAVGPHPKVYVKSRSVLRLVPGTHYFTGLSLEPDSRLEVDESGQPTIIYVRSELTLKGPITDARAGTGSRVLVVYLGTNLAYVEAALHGTVVAPNARVELRSPNRGGKHRGAVFGKEVQVYSASIFEHVPFEWQSFLCPAGDTDGDGVSDCDDVCPRDPEKVQRGACPCGVPDTDGDGDGLPDCLDPCDGDGTKTTVGQCGCPSLGAVAPAGTQCTDAVCPTGNDTCDGAGHCGSSGACAPIAGGACTRLEYDGSVYWYCRAAQTWTQARNLCAAIPGRQLVTLDSQLEDSVIAGWVGSNVWTSGNDRAVDGQWRWIAEDGSAGTRFWNGTSPVERVYADWSSGSPALGTASCLELTDATGTWTHRSCYDRRDFVCEQRAAKLVPWQIPPIRGCDVITGMACTDGSGGTGGNGGTGGTGGTGGPDCVDTDPALTADPAVALAEIQACEAVCTGEGDPDCASCSGVARAPVDGDSCEDWIPEDVALCRFIPGTQACTTDAQCTGPGERCGLKFECEDPTRPFDGTCQAGTHQYCIDPTRDSACTEDGVCDRVCTGVRVCGTTEPDCGNLDGIPDGPCAETILCPGPDETGDSTVAEELLDSQPFDEAEQFDEPIPPPPEFAIDDPCPGYRTGDECRAGIHHRWCSLEAEGTLPHQDADSTNQHGRGGGKLVQFDFDPDLGLDYEATPGVFGEIGFDLTARAALSADVTFSLLGFTGTVDILEAVAGVHASRCQVDTADTKLEIFGIDFLPTLGIEGLPYDSDDALASDDPDAPLPSEVCEAAIDGFGLAVNETRKAYKDAQELVRQYRNLPAGTRFPDDFCELVAGDPPAGFSQEPCTGVTPEETINRFIDYYHAKAGVLGQARAAIVANSPVPTVPPIRLGDPPPRSVSEMANYGHREVQQVAYVPFAIGPVPMSLEIEAFVAYGLGGEFGVTFLDKDLELDGASLEFARVSANVTPWASAGVTMFVGADIDIGIAGVKIGIEGELSLGTVSVPATASAGIEARLVPDEREETDAELLAMTTGQPIFPPGPPRKTELALTYNYGIQAALERILAGEIRGKVRIRVAFFSKSWKKTILSFAGFPVGGGQMVYDLVSGGGDVGVASGIPPVWGVVQDARPFLTMRRLPPDPNAASKSPTGTFRLDDVEELFYDSLCECQAPDEPCWRNDDCCEEAPVCFPDPDSPDPSNPVQTCIACRSATQTCRDDGDCCPEAGNCFDDPETAATPTCISCRSEAETCNDDDDCCGSTPHCYREPTGHRRCMSCNEPLDTCRTNADCCEANDPDYEDRPVQCLHHPNIISGWGNCMACRRDGTHAFDPGDCCNWARELEGYPGIWECYSPVR